MPDSNSGGQRISSQAFSNEHMSVHIGDDLQDAGHALEAVLEKYPHMDLAAITAVTARAAGQAVCRDEVPDELCHGIVAGNKTRSVARRFAAEATTNWLIRRAR